MPDEKRSDLIAKWGVCSECGEPNDPVHVYEDGKLVAIHAHEHPTETLTLSDFLLARLAEDEAESTPSRHATAGRFHAYDCDWVSGPGDCDCGHPARVLADVEAKRRIVRAYAATDGSGDLSAGGEGARFALGQACIALAQPYADHPDYRDEWRA